MPAKAGIRQLWREPRKSLTARIRGGDGCFQNSCIPATTRRKNIDCWRLQANASGSGLTDMQQQRIAFRRTYRDAEVSVIVDAKIGIEADRFKPQPQA